ncbi:MAG: sigma-70 family RNA polymerase sigma factor [Planctomycetales bacterium]|nr:sigma-70 family RNA polymerase sigma factor [Planctomycetales bacterium]
MAQRHESRTAADEQPTAGAEVGGCCASAGDVFAGTWPEHSRWLRTVIAARGVEPSSVDEVLQEVAAAAAASLDRLRDASKVGPWLYRIAVNQALLHRRRCGRQRRLTDRYARRRDVDDANSTPDALNWLIAVEQRELVRQALQELPSRDAEILLLKYTEQWSYREMSAHLGVSEAAVESRLHRARHKLRARLAAALPDFSGLSSATRE